MRLEYRSGLTRFFLAHTIVGVNKCGRARKANTREEYLEVRLDRHEKQALKEAADLIGLPISARVRE